MSDNPLSPDFSPYARITLPDNQLDPSWANAMAYNADWIRQQHLQSQAMGLEDPNTGLPTMAEWRNIAQQYGNALLLGTNAPGIRAYHGSPYSFERFDMSKIGTGEGAQAYGHGLYFAEQPGVAESYKQSNRSTDYPLQGGGTVPDWVGTSIKQIGDQFGTDSRLYGQTIDRHIADFQGRLAEAQEQAKGDVQPWLAEGRIPGLQQVVDSLQKLRSGEATLLPRGSMYEVNLQADPSHFLDWDKPLSEQSQHVRDTLKSFGITDQKMTGQEINEALAERLHTGPKPTGGGWTMVTPERYMDPAAAAQALQNAGIPGIRYLDQGSRASGKGTSNYVVFSPDIINIIRRYGIAGLTGGGAAAGTTPSNNQ